MHFFNLWLIGPQLVGLTFIIAGGIQLMYPPKKINSLYGYRTPTAKENQSKWNEAQLYSGKLMIKLGLNYLIFGFALVIILHILHYPYINLMGILLIFAAISAPVLLMIYTEKHLHKVFK